MDTQGRPAWIKPAKPKIEKFVVDGALPLRTARVVVRALMVVLAPIFALASHDLALGILVVVVGFFVLMWLEFDAKPWQPPRG